MFMTTALIRLSIGFYGTAITQQVREKIYLSIMLVCLWKLLDMQEMVQRL